jgi:hypothetical protein
MVSSFYCFQKEQKKEEAAAVAAAAASAPCDDTSNSDPISISKKAKTITSRTPCILKIDGTVDIKLHKQQWSSCTIMKTPQPRSKLPLEKLPAATATATTTAVTPSTAELSHGDKKKAAAEVLVMSHEILSAERIRDEVRKRMNDPNRRAMKKSNNKPDEVCALFDYLLSMLPRNYFKGTNKVMATKGTDAQKRLDGYRKHFPPGTISFSVPPSDKSKAPDPYYQVLEGRKIYIIRWELNYPGHDLKCFKCNHGDLISDVYDYRSHGYLTPIIDLDGTTSYAASMT